MNTSRSEQKSGRRSVAVIGAGPRGLGVLERLVQLAIAHDRPLDVHIVDPFPPGAGRVWRTDQSPELLMNTVIAEQTVFPDESCSFFNVRGDGSEVLGPTMAEWHMDTAESGSHDANPQATFSARSVYGRYLCDSFDMLRRRAAESGGLIEIIEHRASATALLENSGTAVTPPVIVRLDDTSDFAVDDVVLAVGHIPARLTDERLRLSRFAHDAGLRYCPPNLPAETRVEDIPAGQPVILRGFGLNYFDLQALLTTGRGGTFTPRGGDSRSWELEYHPSGREPRLLPSSRRGVPYRCKPITDEHPRVIYELRFFTPANVDRLSTEPESLFFDDQLWPLILADIRLAWYSALRRQAPQAFTGELSALTEALGEAVDRHLERRRSEETAGGRVGRETAEAPSWQDVLDTVIAPDFHIDLTALNRPMDGLSFDSRAELDAWMREFILDDLAQAHAGPQSAPLKSLFAVLWAARNRLKELVAARRIHPVSFATEVRGWFESYVSGICDGPPPRRFAELAALIDAGIVSCVGPDVHITQSKAGEPAAFVASSPAVGEDVHAQTLIDAASPANQLQLADDQLISGLLDSGALTVATVIGDDDIVQPLSGPLVNPLTLRPIDRSGREHEHLYLVSLQLCAIRLGQAIAANPDSDAQTLRDAHRVAAQVLDLPESC